MIRYTKLAILLLSLLVLMSCAREETVLQKKTNFEAQGWNRFTYLNHQVDIMDSSAPYTFTLKLEFTEEYPYNYLKIQMDKTSSDGEEYVKVFSIPVKDQNGVFLKKEKNGIYQVTMVLSRQIYFSSAGKYQINIEQLMPPYYLKGIKSAEFIIEKQAK